jgi:hypothetical protein
MFLISGIYYLTGPDGAWFVQFEDGTRSWDNLPYDLEEAIQNCSGINYVALGVEGSYVLEYAGYVILLIETKSKIRNLPLEWRNGVEMSLLICIKS